MQHDHDIHDTSALACMHAKCIEGKNNNKSKVERNEDAGDGDEEVEKSRQLLLCALLFLSKV